MKQLKIYYFLWKSFKLMGKNCRSPLKSETNLQVKYWNNFYEFLYFMWNSADYVSRLLSCKERCKAQSNLFFLICMRGTDWIMHFEYSVKMDIIGNLKILLFSNEFSLYSNWVAWLCCKEWFKKYSNSPYNICSLLEGKKN